jgi:hypothetical protein
LVSNPVLQLAGLHKHNIGTTVYQDELGPRDSTIDHDGAPKYLGTILKITRIDTAAQTQSNTSYPCRAPRKNAITTGGSKHQRADTGSSLLCYASVSWLSAQNGGARREELTCPGSEADRASAMHIPRGSGTERLRRSCDLLLRRC